MQVIPLQGFTHYSITAKKGVPIEVPASVANDLKKARLVRFPDEVPSKGAGEKSSALPVAPASPQTTAKKSKRGRKRRTIEPSS